MIEEQWLAYNDIRKIVGFLKRDQKSNRTNAGRRKSRLFACGCCRTLIWNVPVSDGFHRLVEESEAFADNQISSDDLAKAWRRERVPTYGDFSDVHRYWAACAMHSVAAATTKGMIVTVSGYVSDACERPERTQARRRMCGLLRDVFGNPFRPVTLAPAWLKWKDGVVRGIAQSIYEERRFAEMPILGDALEEAGCDIPEVLSHCREPGDHVRGCWVVDLVLGRT